MTEDKTPTSSKKSNNDEKDVNAGVPIAITVITMTGSIIVALISGFSSFANQISPNTILIIGATIFFFLTTSIIGAVTFLIRESNRQSQKTRDKIAQVESRIEDQPEKARPAWDLARITLDAYFNRNLSQITYIFWFSVFVMVIGFVVILWGIFQAVQTPNTATPAIMATLAGIITEFIGATFIFVYRSTLQQALNYMKALERINSVGMAMQILDTIPDEAKPDDLKSKTKAMLVELLAKQSHEAPVSSDIQEGKSQS